MTSLTIRAYKLKTVLPSDALPVSPILGPLLHGLFCLVAPVRCASDDARHRAGAQYILFKDRK